MEYKRSFGRSREKNLKGNYFKLSVIYETGELPEYYVKSLITPIPKKTAARKCEEYHTMSFLSHTSKIENKYIKRL